MHDLAIAFATLINALEIEIKCEENFNEFVFQFGSNF